MPTPEVPESYAPRNEGEQRIYNLGKEGLDSGPGKTYASVTDFIAELRPSTQHSKR